MTTTVLGLPPDEVLLLALVPLTLPFCVFLIRVFGELVEALWQVGLLMLGAALALVEDMWRVTGGLFHSPSSAVQTAAPPVYPPAAWTTAPASEPGSFVALARAQKSSVAPGPVAPESFVAAAMAQRRFVAADESGGESVRRTGSPAVSPEESFVAPPVAQGGVCAVCGRPLARAQTGRPARFCSATCRSRAFRAKARRQNGQRKPGG